ncbi:MAG: ribosome assembly RNA-binding protein YhbY [Thiohalocapsa sp.]|jgi:RNA-binding protein|uniref:ribosome assembly RNA-binding protein YhbY n=1 Tax=Thiohalocapsa sp. TaxID=2497641 RepID=UPI0025DF2B16|nr:ribosome assembly RNA-binding protein YhbY [Thiohalocapsa sp.]MCG6939759.1 ribosome assembly RNA-binding protein YhbY [Thiohalocapsa sp.]
MTTHLNNQQRRALKQLAHHLKPVVLLGAAGLTEPVLAEIGLALSHHELIKVRVNGGDRDGRDAQVRTIVEETGAALVQRIGNVAVLYRANPELKEPIRLPG